MFSRKPYNFYVNVQMCTYLIPKRDIRVPVADNTVVKVYKRNVTVNLIQYPLAITYACKCFVILNETILLWNVALKRIHQCYTCAIARVSG